jgi:hypothetical protein
MYRESRFEIHVEPSVVVADVGQGTLRGVGLDDGEAVRAETFTSRVEELAGETLTMIRRP